MVFSLQAMLFTPIHTCLEVQGDSVTVAPSAIHEYPPRHCRVANAKIRYYN
jgi:hypothetical protein